MPTDDLEWIRDDYASFEQFRESLFTDGGRFPYLKPIASANAHTIPSTDDPRAEPIINMSGYDYLGLNESTAVRNAARNAIDLYGISTAASRLVSGELDIHGQLEAALASFLGADDCLVLVSGHATNVMTIGHLFGPDHVLLCDQYSHNSVETGAKLSGAEVVKFRHNDVAHLEEIIESIDAPKVAVCIEGLYSMDGDIPPLPDIIALKSKFEFTIYLDEAHSIGTLGATGRGVCEHFGIPTDLIDVRMGTLSKTFASCGGYIVGSWRFIEYLKLSSPGFIFSTGLPAPLAAAALAAVTELREHPEYTQEVQHASTSFSTLLTGDVQQTPIVPLHIDPESCFAVGRKCQEAGVRVFPITFPAVPRSATRLRFFLSRLHTTDQLTTAASRVLSVIDGVETMPSRV